MHKPKLAIQFVNYKTKQYLTQSLKDVLIDLGNQEDYKIYILDNDSGEDLSDLRQERVSVKNSSKNVGFGAGHNLLAKEHSAEYILILNPDIRIIEPNTITRLMQSLQETPEAAVVGPKLTTKEDTLQEWDHGELDVNSGKYSPKSYWEERSDKGEVAWVSGAVLLIKGDAFKFIGGFDESFFLYKEEEDLCLRLRKKGLKTYYNPRITVTHYGSVVTSKSNEHFVESIEYYNKKHQLGS